MLTPKMETSITVIRIIDCLIERFKNKKDKLNDINETDREFVRYILDLYEQLIEFYNDKNNIFKIDSSFLNTILFLIKKIKDENFYDDIFNYEKLEIMSQYLNEE